MISIDSNIRKILSNVFKNLDIKYTKTYITEYFNTHPNFPSLKSITELLSEYNIESLVIKIDYKKLDQITFPAIALLEDNKQKYFVAIKNVAEGQIEYFDSNNNVVIEKIIEFNNKWSGKIILIEKKSNSKEPNYIKNYQKEYLLKNRIR